MNFLKPTMPSPDKVAKYPHYRLWYDFLLRHFLILCGLMVLTVAIQPLPTLATGPGTGGSKIQIDNAEVGPYVLLVATSPQPLAVGQMSVWVRVIDAESSKARRDAQVLVQATPMSEGEQIAGQGSHQNAGNDIDYVAHLDVEQAGEWNFTIMIEDELGEAQVDFTDTVSTGSNLGLILSLSIPFIVLTVVVGIYLWQKSARSAGKENL